MSNQYYSARNVINIYSESGILAESPLGGLSRLSLQISTKKTLCWEQGIHFKRSGIHHLTYEVLKFYFIGQDSVWQTLESILW